MRRIGLVLFLVASLSAVGAAQAQQFSSVEERMSAADFKRAGLDKLSEEELAALNTWLQQDSTRRVTAAPAEDRRGIRATSQSDAQPVSSRLPGEFKGWSNGTVFRLENGQVWRSVDSDSTLTAVNLPSPMVTIRKGFLGNWRMTVEGYNTSVKVERVE